MSSRRPLFAANWKMHKTRSEARSFLADLTARDLSGPAGDVAVFAPATCLSEFEGKGIPFGAQNMHYEAKGAFTGEISSSMVLDLGASLILIGHSERRQLFGETDATCRKKVEVALEAGLTPVVCIGETLEERESHGHFAKIAKQVRAVSEGLREAQALKLIFAYEPIWAIGTGKVASEAQAQEMCAHVRKIFREEVGSVADSTRVLYGGSVKPENVAGIMAGEDVDGALIGGASLDPEKYYQILVEGSPKS